MTIQLSEKEKYIEQLYKDLIYKRSYSRWLDSENRRENWEETIDRYKNYFLSRIPKKYEKEFSNVCENIKEEKQMPSMRCLWVAGEALDRENVAGYNCAYTTISKIKSFSEILYILMNGTGIGFSVENKYTSQLPTIPNNLNECDDSIIVVDSKRGWAESYYKYMKGLYEGKIYNYDLSKVRPEGARLKIFGGKASGPEPLRQLFEFTKIKFIKSKGKKLSSLDCYDICCYIANTVISGGVRRSAGASLSDLNDNEMRYAKTGDFFNENRHRSLTNNSAVFESKPDVVTFLKEWKSLIQSRSGERGIFNRESAKFVVAQTGNRDPNLDYGCNPCFEVILRPEEFCNLTEVIIRPKDSKEDLLTKVRNATILGCVQSTLSNFKFINRNWKKNTEEERLLGVSLTGLRDHPVLNSVNNIAKLWLTEMQQIAIDTSIEWSKILGINTPASVTCVKPSGSVSQLVGCSSGLHPRYAPYYIRRIRISKTDAISDFLINKGIKVYPEVGYDLKTTNTYVFEFPSRALETSIVVDEVSALDQLEYWLMLQKYWCTHKPSCTIYVKDNEWIEVANWVYRNWNYVSGISFLPVSNDIYSLAPYEEIDEDEYLNMVENFPKDITFYDLSKYEVGDNTEGSREFACVGGSCEI